MSKPEGAQKRKSGRQTFRMISGSSSTNLAIGSPLQLLLLLLVAGQQVVGQQYQYLDQLAGELAPAGGADLSEASSRHHGGSPGHYEFEVAPKMEPPSVRRPPYRQTDQLCPGSGKSPGRAENEFQSLGATLANSRAIRPQTSSAASRQRTPFAAT